MSTKELDGHGAMAAINLGVSRKMADSENTGQAKGSTTRQRPMPHIAGKSRDSVEILERLREKEMLVPGSKMGPEIRNEYRRIKRPLLSNAFGKTASLVDSGNLIAVTSSAAGEGKSYTSLNLALAFAQ